jgi:hypothetical protein
MNIYIVLLYDYETDDTHIMGCFLKKQNAIEFILDQPDSDYMRIETNYLKDFFGGF